MAWVIWGVEISLAVGWIGGDDEGYPISLVKAQVEYRKKIRLAGCQFDFGYQPIRKRHYPTAMVIVQVVVQ